MGSGNLKIDVSAKNLTHKNLNRSHIFPFFFTGIYMLLVIHVIHIYIAPNFLKSNSIKTVFLANSPHITNQEMRKIFKTIVNITVGKLYSLNESFWKILSTPFVLCTQVCWNDGTLNSLVYFYFILIVRWSRNLYTYMQIRMMHKMIYHKCRKVNRKSKWNCQEVKTITEKKLMQNVCENV